MISITEWFAELGIDATPNKCRAIFNQLPNEFRPETIVTENGHRRWIVGHYNFDSNKVIDFINMIIQETESK